MIDRIIPLAHLTILILNSLSFSKISYTTIQESQTFKTISRKNKIPNMTIEEYCTLDNVTLLKNLCPRLQYLTIDISPNYHQDQYIVTILVICFHCIFKMQINYRGRG